MDAVIQNIVNGLQNSLHNDYLVVLIISILPLIEVRGAIPIALELGIKPFFAFLFSSLSALIMCPILIFCFKPILNALKKTKIFKKLAKAIEENFQEKADKIEKNAEKKSSNSNKILKTKKLLVYEMIGLFLFVAIPLPATGLWTGTIVALLINMDIKHSIIPIILGNFCAAGIITIMSVLLGDKSYWILFILFIFILITIIMLIISMSLKAKKKKAFETNSKASDIYSDKDI